MAALIPTSVVKRNAVPLAMKRSRFMTPVPPLKNGNQRKNGILAGFLQVGIRMLVSVCHCFGFTVE
jgi:hypothetical protein